MWFIGWGRWPSNQHTGHDDDDKLKYGKLDIIEVIVDADNERIYGIRVIPEPFITSNPHI
jgi:hypothetical protein